MNQNVEREKALGRIRKLQAQTVDRGCTESQAEMAMRLIGELLDAYDITLDEVSLSENPCKEFVINTGRGKGPKMANCVVRLAEFCGCIVFQKTSYTSDYKKEINYVFYGLDQDVDMLAYLYETIDNALNNETKKFKNTNTYKRYTGHRRVMTNSFQEGFTSRINVRLREIKEERERAREARQSENIDEGSPERPFTKTGKSIVEMKQEKVRGEFKDKYGWLPKNKNRYRNTNFNSSGYNAGQAAGNNVSLKRPVGNGGGHSGQALIGG